MPRISNLFLLVPLLAVSACGVPAFVSPKTNPIITNKSSGDGRFYQTIGTTAERRLVLIKQLGSDEVARLQARNEYVGEGFCAEPSPDSIEAVNASFNATAKNTAAANSQEVALGKALLTSAALATKRTQGLQFYRDTIFGLCQARLNGFIGNQELARELANARAAALQMILAEVGSPSFASQPQINVTVAANQPAAAPKAAPGN